jgi:hypothetical protein
MTNVDAQLNRWTGVTNVNEIAARVETFKTNGDELLFVQMSDFDPQYQRGKTDVSHRNIDAAGNDHPFGNEAQSFEADLRHLIRKVADDLYQSWKATFREYLANAETACLKVQNYLDDPESSMYDEMYVPDSYQPKVEVEWNRAEDTVTISDNGIGMAAREVDEIFRQIGHSAARDDGTKSGQFGMGALSFVKTVGLDNAMIMTSHSRLNGDNASYYVTLAGVEPIMGSLPDDQFGTEFQMTPQGDYQIREAISQYAEWMRVPVRYEEFGEDGTVVFQEDYGDKALYESFSSNRICVGVKESNAYEAYCSPDADGRTLLLSMDIDRNDGEYGARSYEAPFDFDVRLLDESGKVIQSSNGNEGLMPTPRSDYESMLLDARDPYIAESMLNNGDIVAQELVDGDALVVSDEVYEDIQNRDIHVPPNEYVPKSDVMPDAEPGETQIISGPNKGKVVVSDDEWDEMDAGRAELYVPEDELEEYDLDSEEGDLCLPQPTSDRDRLQQNTKFWKYVARQIGREFDEKASSLYEDIDDSPDWVEVVMDLDPEDMVVNPEGFEG